MSEFNENKEENSINESKKKPNRVKGWIALIIFLGIANILVALYFGWFLPIIRKPLAATLSLPQVSIATNTIVIPTETPTLEPTVTPEPSPTPTKLPVCGDEAIWNVLLVGVDTQGQNYLYGLADVIRIAQIDFREMTVNIIALPRDLIVSAPEGLFKEENPMKINQSYLFGTAGWTGSSDLGNGAVTLAQVIYNNFGIAVDHYGVVNFTGVMEFIDALGGLTIDLPYEVYDPDPAYGYYPAGVQTLTGERTMDLMRIRTNYSDNFRIGNQSIVLKAIIKKMLDPAIILKLPELVEAFKHLFLTDLSIEQIVNLGTCFLKNFNPDNILTVQPPEEYLDQGMEYIPTLGGHSSVYRWDQRLIDWIHSHIPEK